MCFVLLMVLAGFATEPQANSAPTSSGLSRDVPASSAHRKHVVSSFDFSPVVGARVLLRNQPGDRDVFEREAHTDRWGSFVADVPGYHRGEYLIQAEGFTPWKGSWSKQDRNYLEPFVELIPGIEAAGRVVDHDGLPVQGEVTVTPIGHLGVNRRSTVDTDHEGGFRVLVPDQSYSVVIANQGSRPSLRQPTRFGMREYVLSGGDGLFRGRVLGSDQRPVPGATVILTYLFPMSTRLVETDPEGLFEAHDRDSVSRLIVSKEGFATQEVPDLHAALAAVTPPSDGEPKCVELVLEELRAVRLTLTANGAQELPLQVRYGKSTQLPLGSSILYVPFEESTLELSLLGVERSIPLGPDVVGEDRESTLGPAAIDVGTVDFPITTMPLRLRDSDGQPISGASVQVAGFATPLGLPSRGALDRDYETTSENGLTTIYGGRRRFARIRVIHPEFYVEQFDLHLGHSLVNVTMKRLAVLTGAVMKRDGVPLAGAVVRLSGTCGPGASLSQKSSRVQGLTRTDADGSFALRPSPLLHRDHPGAALKLIVSAPGYRTVKIPWQARLKDEAFDFGPVVLEPIALMEGVVRDSAGRPISGLGINFQSDSKFGYFDADHASFVTDAQGRYRIPQIEPGDYWISLVTENHFVGRYNRRVTATHRPMAVNWIVERARALPVAAAPLTGGSMRVELTTEDGGVPASAVLLGWSWRSTYENGILTASQLPVGEQVFWIQCEGYPATPIKAVTLSDRETKLQAKVLSKRKLLVDVRGPRGLPSPDARVSTDRDGFVRTGEDGRVFVGLPATGPRASVVSQTGNAIDPGWWRFAWGRTQRLRLTDFPAATLNVNVVDPNGNAVSANLYLQPPLRVGATVQPAMKLGSVAHAFSHQVRSGPHLLWLSPGSNGCWASERVFLRPGETRSLEVTVHPGRLIVGSLRRDGAVATDLPQVDVQLLTHSGAWTKTAHCRVDSEGKFRVYTRIPPKRIRVDVDGIWDHHFWIEAEEVDGRVRIDFSSPIVVRGVVRDHRLEPGSLPKSVGFDGKVSGYGKVLTDGTVDFVLPPVGVYQLGGRYLRNGVIPVRFVDMAVEGVVPVIDVYPARPITFFESEDGIRRPARPDRVHWVTEDGARTFSWGLWPAAGGDGVAWIYGQVAHFKVSAQSPDGKIDSAASSSSAEIDLQLRPGGVLHFHGSELLLRELVGKSVDIVPLGHSVSEVFLRWRLQVSGVQLPLPEGRYRVTVDHKGQTLGAEVEIRAGVDSELILR